MPEIVRHPMPQICPDSVGDGADVRRPMPAIVRAVLPRSWQGEVAVVEISAGMPASIGRSGLQICGYSALDPADLQEAWPQRLGRHAPAMRRPTASEIATIAGTCTVIATLAGIAGWARAARAEARVDELADQVHELNGAVQALHEDLDQTRAAFERAVERR